MIPLIIILPLPVRRIIDEVGSLNTATCPPHVLIVNTIFGKGVSYMEGLIEWHYRPISKEPYEAAVQEVDGAPA